MMLFFFFFIAMYICLWYTYPPGSRIPAILYCRICSNYHILNIFLSSLFLQQLLLRVLIGSFWHSLIYLINCLNLWNIGPPRLNKHELVIRLLDHLQVGIENLGRHSLGPRVAWTFTARDGLKHGLLSVVLHGIDASLRREGDVVHLGCVNARGFGLGVGNSAVTEFGGEFWRRFTMEAGVWGLEAFLETFDDA